MKKVPATKSMTTVTLQMADEVFAAVRLRDILDGEGEEAP